MSFLTFLLLFECTTRCKMKGSWSTKDTTTTTLSSIQPLWGVFVMPIIGYRCLCCMQHFSCCIVTVCCTYMSGKIDPFARGRLSSLINNALHKKRVWPRKTSKYPVSFNGSIPLLLEVRQESII